jgi:hypothetical protein
LKTPFIIATVIILIALCSYIVGYLKGWTDYWKARKDRKKWLRGDEADSADQ